MEKIITINLAGRVLALEDAAYTALKAYIESLQRHFAGEEGGAEILNDIENRVAELLAAKLAAGAAAITEAHIAEVIATMGRAEDFAGEDGGAPETPGASGSTFGTRNRRFLRDEKDKMLGGICSGLASYLNVDPALIRIVFALLALGGWGSGILLYIVLWAVVPAGAVPPFSGRRLHRNPDDKWLGGVASGMAAYFDKETWIFRLLFAAPLLLSLLSGGVFDVFGSYLFGSLGGTFVLIYIMLWMVLPVAVTEFQKMEMRGERVDIHSIRDNVYADLKDRAQAFSHEVRDSASRFMNERGRAFAQEARTAGRPLARRGGEVITTLFRAFFLFIGSAIAFLLFLLLIGYFFGGFSELANNFLFATPTQRTLAWVTVLLLLGTPVLSLLTGIARRVLRLQPGATRYFQAGYSMLWVAGIGCALVLATSLRREFRHREVTAQELPIAQPRSGSLLLTVPGPELRYSNSLDWMQGDIPGWDVNGSVMQSARVAILPTLSPDSSYHLILKRQARGRSTADARQRAGALQYTASTLAGTDSIVVLDASYSIPKALRYRAQAIVIELQVPAGKRVRFDETVADKLIDFYPTVYTYRRGKHWETRWEETTNDDWEPGIEYIMQPNGRLLDPLNPEEPATEPSYQNSRRESATDRRADSLQRVKDELERELDRIEG